MDTFDLKPAVAAMPARRSWRRHSKEFRSQVVGLARQPNTSIAAVALANGLNANMLRRWVREAECGDPRGEAASGLAAAQAFVQLPMPGRLLSTAAADSTAAGVIVSVEIQRNGAVVRASLPLDSRSAAWLREVTA